MAQAVVNEDVWGARREMIDDLLEELRARAAGDPREVRLEETHVSWVLLGREVFKIKKPVRLPFLDFSSFEAREAACRAEVRVNRRLAPRTYLGVVPIRRTPRGKATFGPNGVIVDWAVCMLRLDERRRADVLLARGALTTAHVDAVAAGIAAFHADAATNPRIARVGAPDVIAKNVTDNFDAMRDAVGELVRAPAAEEIEAGQRAFVRESAALLERRMATGAIRDGHGDLRLEHVFFSGHDDDFDVIDGIEFDDRYRFADVAADVAFLAMDLARLGRVDLAERFLASYARAANDFDLYRVVDFYEGYRACVRAKIAALVAADPSAPHTAKEMARAEARRYLLLAQAVRRRALVEPTLVAVAGTIASGKSTLAEALAEELSAPIVDADRTRKFMIGLPPTAHADASAWTGAYEPSFSASVYAEVLRRAEAVLASGRPVIVDASFRTRAARAAIRGLAESQGVPLRLFECTAPIDVCRARVAARDRSKSVSDGRVEVFDAFVAGYEPIDELAASEHVRIDTSGSPAAALDEAKRHVATWPRGLVG